MFIYSNFLQFVIVFYSKIFLFINIKFFINITFFSIVGFDIIKQFAV